MQPQATAKGVRMMDLGAGEPGVPRFGGEHRTRQALVDPLSNAVEFTLAGGEVTVTCGVVAEPDPGVRIGDAGSPESGRAESADATAGWAFVRVRDTGPGPAISRRLARLMGGA